MNEIKMCNFNMPGMSSIVSFLQFGNFISLHKYQVKNIFLILYHSEHFGNIYLIQHKKSTICSSNVTVQKYKNQYIKHCLDCAEINTFLLISVPKLYHCVDTKVLSQNTTLTIYSYLLYSPHQQTYLLIPSSN